MFALYLLGIVVAVLTGLIMRHTLFKGSSSPFILELPHYHLPRLQSVLLRTWDRLKTFIINAGKVIVPMVLILNFLNALGIDGSFGRENSKQSVLSEIGRSLTPIFAPMGIEKENWPATVGIFTGVLAKEAVVGTLDALYSEMAALDNPVAQPAFDLEQALLAACLTVPENLVKVVENVLDPLRLSIGEISDIKVAAEAQSVSTGTFSAMQKSFNGQIGAFAYLLFILLYTPCVAATAAIYKETSLGWTVFVSLWTTSIAYMISTLFYQSLTYALHPESTCAWITGLLLLFCSVILVLRLYGRYQDRIALSVGTSHDFV